MVLLRESAAVFGFKSSGVVVRVPTCMHIVKAKGCVPT